VSVTPVLTQLLQYTGAEVGVMEKAKNYYVVLEHRKDGKWNLPLDEWLSKEIKKCAGEIMLLKNTVVISVQIPLLRMCKISTPSDEIYPSHKR
jgi:hypothetical protein